MKPVFTGCATALITPFTADLKDVDDALFAELCREQIDRHADALVVAGTTGESPVLSRDEKNRLIRIAVSVSAGRVPVIAGAGSNDTEQALRKANDAEKQGADAILAVTPYYNKCTQDGVIAHYYYIADRISCPLIVYNVPSRTGFNILPETYAALSAHPRIAGIKEANGDISSVAKTAALCGDRLTIYSGNDDQTLPILALGGKGVISVVSNLIPDAMHELTGTALHSDFEAAKAIHERYLPLMNAMFGTLNPIPVKKAVGFVKNRKLPLRLPLRELPDNSGEALKTLLKQYGLIQ